MAVAYERRFTSLLRWVLSPRAMNLLRICVTALFCSLAVTGTARGQGFLDSLTSDLNIRGLATTMDPETGIVTVTGDVNIVYGDVEIRCGSARYNQTTGEVVAKDGVTIWRAGTIYRGDSITYNSVSGEMSGQNVVSGMVAGPNMVFYKAEDFQSKGKLENQIDATVVNLTSHDVQNPNFHLGAKEMTVYPGDHMVMRHVKIYGGDTPFFWLSRYTQSLEENGLSFSPGYQSRWGAYLLTRYAVMHGDHTMARYKVDLRSRRGIAAGVDFISLRHKANAQNFGTFKVYAANDIDSTRYQAGTTRFPVPDNRFRINFQHRVYLPGPDVSTWYLDFDINKISDYHFYEDYFFNDFRTDREPDNQVSLIHTDDAYVATLMAKFEANSFYRTTTRLPELSVDFTRRPLWETGIYHQGSLSAGIYNEVVGRQEEAELLRLQALGAGPNLAAVLDDTLGAPSAFRTLAGLQRDASLNDANISTGLGVIGSRLQEPDFARFHTYHELLYPKTYLGWLNVTPRIGAGLTSYGSIHGSTTGLQSFSRGIFHLGLDLSFKLSRAWNNVYSESLGLNGIRHIFQPYINYSYLDAKQDPGLPAIDRISSPTTRPRSIDVPFFTAVDSLRSWNIARVGFRNVFQTKRDSATAGGYGNSIDPAEAESPLTYAWAGMNTYADLFAKDPEFGRDISNIYNEIFWRPVHWVTLRSDWQIPISSGIGNFTELNNFLTWLPSKSVSIDFGHQYISDHPFFLNSSRLFTRLFTRVSENYGLSMTHIFEADDGTLEFQSYSVTRDLSSWTASLGIMARDNRNGVSDVGLLLTLTLKDFPKLNFDFNMDPNPSGAGATQ
jgi:lipopolysaccharide assembly outer membrane protein LptD (OstA)